jgi:hypothetical protein
MYADPSLIRDVVIRVRLNDAESGLLDAIQNLTGHQKSTLIRDLFLAGAMKVLAGEMDVTPTGQVVEAPQRALFGTR